MSEVLALQGRPCSEALVLVQIMGRHMSLLTPEPGDLLGHQDRWSKSLTNHLERRLGGLFCFPGSPALRGRVFGMEPFRMEDSEVIFGLELTFSE